MYTGTWFPDNLKSFLLKNIMGGREAELTVAPELLAVTNFVDGPPP